MSRRWSILGRAWAPLREVMVGGLTELFPSVINDELQKAARAGWRLDEAGAYCRRCGASVGRGEVTPRGCSQCATLTVPWDGVRRLGPYGSPLSQWIVAMKFEQAWAWADWMGRRLAEAAASEPKSTGGNEAVVYVPMPWLRRWRRGYNQAELIARTFAAARGLRCLALLRRKGFQLPQTSVPAPQRLQNVREAFTIEAVDLTGWRLWLVDDVKTTGATLNVCTRLLKDHGAACVNIVVAAVAARDAAAT